MTLLRCLLAALVVASLTTRHARAETPPSHIRLVVDTSQSLHTNDPSGYVKLTTQLLYDLALGVHTPVDSFKVLPFQNWPKWKATGQPPLVPTVPKNLVAPRQWSPEDRKKFMDATSAVPYDAPETYFSSSIEWALNDLRSTNPTSNRVIVLITDGLSDNPDDDAKALENLAQPLHDAKVNVYVLAFGPQAEANKKWFETNLALNTAAGPAGEILAEAGAERLVENVLKIFSTSFGYTSKTFSGSTLDIAEGARLEHAAIVSFSPSANKVGFGVRTPAGNSLSPSALGVDAVPDPKAKAPTRPASYAIKWLNPQNGSYQLDWTGPPATQRAVLRPIRVEAEIRSFNGGPVDAVMAGKPTPLQVVVHPKDGRGDPGAQVRVKFVLHYGTKDDASEPQEHDSEAPGMPGQEFKENGVVTGRAFQINVEFKKDPPDLPSPYTGYIDVIVEQSEVAVERSADRMHQVKVYPYLSLTPRQSKFAADDNGRDLLKAGDKGCVQFTLEGDAKQLGEAKYSLGARLTSQVALDGPLRGAAFVIDERELDSRAAQLRLPFAASEIGTRVLNLCLRVGRPAAAASRQVTLHLGLLLDSDSYYEQLNVISPDVTATFNIDGPGFSQLWGSWLILLLSLLLLSLLALLLRSHVVVPPDLSVALGDGTIALMPASLGEPTIVSRGFGRPQERPVISISGDVQLGSVRPLKNELFVFVPERGVGGLAEEENGGWVPVERREDGSSTVKTGRVYRAGRGDKIHYFRLDYSKDRPRV